MLGFIHCQCVYECDEDDESDGRVSSITGAGRWLVSLSPLPQPLGDAVKVEDSTRNSFFFPYFWYGGSILLLLGKNRTVPPRSGPCFQKEIFSLSFRHINLWTLA
jgi:hypothetical protein